MGFNLMDYAKGNQGLIPDWSGRPTREHIKDTGRAITGAEKGEGWFPGDQSGLTKYVPGFQVGDKAAGPFKIKPQLDFWSNLLFDKRDHSGATDAGASAGDQVPPSSITEFNMDDPESVMNLQKRLGVKADGMFGPKTEAAYRAAVEGERQAADPEAEALDYDYNDAINQGGGGLGGFLKNAYYNVDKKLGGHLPGGQRDSNVMSAEEYENR